MVAVLSKATSFAPPLTRHPLDGIMETVCTCEHAPHRFYADEAPEGFRASLAEVDVGDWRRLWQCAQCGALWSIDEPDKYSHVVVLKVESRASWNDRDDTAGRKALLLESRGGTETTSCIWAGCDRPRVQGVVYCIDHLWSTGARR